MNERVANPGKVEDIYDGNLYQRFKNSLNKNDKHSYITTVFNSDESPLFKSSKYSIWPIQLIINELPHDVRFKNTLTVAMWFGKGKPIMPIFMKQFVKYMNHLSTTGISCEIGGRKKMIKMFALCACVDTMCRPTMQGIIQFHGKFGCSWCYHPGEMIGLYKHKSRKYCILDD